MGATNLSSLRVLYFQHKTGPSSSPSCYKLESGLTTWLKLFSQKPPMPWLPSPITSQFSSLSLHSGDSQPWLQIRSTKKILMPGPHPQRAGYLLNAPQVILICHQDKEPQLDNTDSTHWFSSSAWNAWSPWHHTYWVFLFLLLFFFNIFVWSLLWFHLLCQLFIFLSTLI